MPTIGMVEVKSALTAIMATDPTLVPDRLSREQLTGLVGDRRLPGYFKRHGKAFHAWLMNKYEHAAMADAMYHEWLILARDRLRSADMADKDFIKLGDFLAEVAKKKPERWMKEKIIDADVAKMDDARMMETLLATAKSLGWEVKIPDGAPGATLLGAQPDGAQPAENEADASPDS